MLDETNVLFPYYATGNNLVAAKYRTGKGKEFWFKGDKDAVTLFGIHAASGSRRIIVTEGELDALAAHQMTGYSAVSIPFGADTADKYVKKALRWLERFDDIVICFDNDEPGRAAQQKVLSILKPGKARGMVLPAGFKDANDMLKAGQVEQFKAAFFAAQANIPVGIVSKSEAIERTLSFLRDHKRRVGLSTGYKSLDELVGGWREGEVHTFVAGTGIGKSTWVRNLCYRYLELHRDNPEAGSVLYIPLEDMFEVSIARFAEMKLNSNLIKREHATLDVTSVTSVLSDMLERLLVLDTINGDINELVTSIEYMVRQHDVKFIVLDHITALANSIPGSDERKALDRAIETLKFRVAKELKCTVVVVCHMARNSADEEDNKPSLARIKGASSIAQYSDTVFAVTRNRKTNETRIETLKVNRVWGQYGKFSVVWNPATYQLEESDTATDNGDDEYVFDDDDDDDEVSGDDEKTQTVENVREPGRSGVPEQVRAGCLGDQQPDEWLSRLRGDSDTVHDNSSLQTGLSDEERLARRIERIFGPGRPTEVEDYKSPITPEQWRSLRSRRSLPGRRR
jgi:twinkle protein